MPDSLSQVLELIDAANALDPNIELDENGNSVAKELLYSQRMSETLSQFCESASAHLQIAARAQHIERWRSPRSDYPLGKVGYKQWRLNLLRYHAERAAELMLRAGYDDNDTAIVKNLITKKKLKTNSDSQTLEDIVCLVFLEHYLDSFAAKHSDEKVIDILQKTWKKMSENGHRAALKLKYSPDMETLIKQALA